MYGYWSHCSMAIAMLIEVCDHLYRFLYQLSIRFCAQHPMKMVHVYVWRASRSTSLSCHESEYQSDVKMSGCRVGARRDAPLRSIFIAMVCAPCAWVPEVNAVRHNQGVTPRWLTILSVMEDTAYPRRRRVYHAESICRSPTTVVPYSTVSNANVSAKRFMIVASGIPVDPS